MACAWPHFIAAYGRPVTPPLPGIYMEFSSRPRSAARIRPFSFRDELLDARFHDIAQAVENSRKARRR